MKEKTHKITPDLQKDIYLVASTLPPMARADKDGNPIYKQVVVPGTKVKKQDLKPGTPLLPDAMYKLNELQYVNHAMVIIGLVQRDGPMAIKVYESDVWAQYELMKIQAKKSNSLITKIKKWINKLRS